jgi:SAM-dependent methyltransferase
MNTRTLTNEQISDIINKQGGIFLDVGCGKNRLERYIGMDRRDIPEADIVHDLEIFPYPLPDDCCTLIVANQIIEHIKPWLTIDFMNELWRIMKVDGKLIINTPYGGSPAYWQDPTHCNGCNVGTFMYFDPKFPLYEIYEPSPWNLYEGYPALRSNGHIEAMMKKMDRNYTIC